MPETVHISSLLLRADPDKMSSVLNDISAVPNVEIPLTDESGKIIVTLETDSEAEIVDSLTKLQLIDGVMSASLVYHQMD